MCTQFTMDMTLHVRDGVFNGSVTQHLSKSCYGNISYRILKLRCRYIIHILLMELYNSFVSTLFWFNNNNNYGANYHPPCAKKNPPCDVLVSWNLTVICSCSLAQLTLHYAAMLMVKLLLDRYLAILLFICLVSFNSRLLLFSVHRPLFGFQSLCYLVKRIV